MNSQPLLSLTLKPILILSWMVPLKMTKVEVDFFPSHRVSSLVCIAESINIDLFYPSTQPYPGREYLCIPTDAEMHIRCTGPIDSLDLHPGWFPLSVGVLRASNWGPSLNAVHADDEKCG